MRDNLIIGRAKEFLDSIARKYDEGRSHEVAPIEKFINDTETLAELRHTVRLINEQRFIRDNLKRKLASNRDRGVGNDYEHDLFSKRIKEYEDSIRVNIGETERIATKYGWKDDFCFLPEKNSFFFNLGEKPYSVMDMFFLVIQKIKISSINIFGIWVQFDPERK